MVFQGNMIQGNMIPLRGLSYISTAEKSRKTFCNDGKNDILTVLNGTRICAQIQSLCGFARLNGTDFHKKIPCS